MQHDACGVGFVATLRGAADREVLSCALGALKRLVHRGAPASLGAVDGCGILTDIPWAVLTSTLGQLPEAQGRALGMLFVHPPHQQAAISLVEQQLEQAGANSIVWRRVPTDGSVVLRAQQQTTPAVLQVLAGFAKGKAAAAEAAFRARVQIEALARERRIRVSVASLSTRTVVYKALVTPGALDRFYPDLADPRFASRFVVFHQRFSTNTSADWALTQPFRILAHNGEINTIAGNRSWMRARLRDRTSLPGFESDAPIASDGSDSRTLDDAADLMRSAGYWLPHALSRLVPPAWERDRDLAPDVRAFFEFQSLLCEPWDGPSALAFGDGRYVGAALDRNGFRPARVVRTSSDLVAVASETGVLPASEHDIIDRDRLGPGDMLAVDLDRGAILRTEDIRRRLAFRRPYGALVERAVRHLVPSIGSAARRALDRETASEDALAILARRQAAAGCTREEIELLLKPMVVGAHEAVGSMGDDTPPAVLSAKRRLFTDFFRQRFAQVTNPPVDPYREVSVMSLTTALGAHGSFFDETAPRLPRVVLRSPILTCDQVTQLLATAELAPTEVATTLPVGESVSACSQFDRRLEGIADEACEAVERGSALLLLTDRAVDADHVALPALLATAAVHEALITRGLRMRASIVVETADARDAHQIAVLCAYGASAVCPWLGFDTVAALGDPDETGCNVTPARYRLALERGLLTIMSKMGVCTFSGYCGSQLFEILGLDSTVVDRFFPGTASPLGGVGLASVAATVFDRHGRAFAAELPALEYPGLHSYRRGGEYHATNPVVVKGLQRAREAHHDRHEYATFTSHVYNRPPSAVRDLLTFVNGTPIELERVESVDAICRRFFASAMSVGALSPEAHRTIALAMNRLGARSNSGEGGEEPDRFNQPDGNRTRQVASARFGVTPAYLRSADELQIKIAQGSKPGEGGQLPAVKVVQHIARLRHAQPGTTLISPPVHHDIYSIEDLAQLIFDLRAFHPSARINVKLVASSGVGIIATGVAKAGADAIQISGHDGGTGASPRASIKHAGLPWEVGLLDAHQALLRADLRSRVVLQTDGGLKTGRDVAVAAALGADEYGFGTAALVAIGCVMARQCHANTCPVGIATQREDLRASFSGTADMLVDYLRLIAGEVRDILGSLGLASMDDLIGRTDLVRPRDLPADQRVALAIQHSTWYSALRARHALPSVTPPPSRRRHVVELSGSVLSDGAVPDGVSPQSPLTVAGTIANTDRAFGAAIAGAIAAQHGDAGLPGGSVRLNMTGSAGQSFGAFALPGMHLTLVGDANDGVGKGMHGGEIVVCPAARERGRRRQVLIGNAALYGATGGRLFVAGRAGERFAVRNSGASAVVEGVGDHGCEYMTGGVVVILDDVGRNFGAGMTGGVAYVRARQPGLITRMEAQPLAVEALSPFDQAVLRELLEAHEGLTGSRLARAILRHDPALTTFKRIAARSMIAALGDVPCTSPLEKSTSSSYFPPVSWRESAAPAV